jgi:predicted RNA-binding protein YlxR (DUF448 family)
MRARSRGVVRGGGTPPTRSCVVCRTTAAKRALHRIVRSPSGAVAYDPTGKAPGRGAYLCGRPACLETAGRRRKHQRALKVSDAAAVDDAVAALRAALRSEAVARPSPHSRNREEVRTG